MSGPGWRLWDLFRISKPSSQTTDKGTTILGPDISNLSTSKAKSKTDEFGFLELASGTDPIVDIVAIHGLDGHREKTWTAESGVLWLRDLLPADIPNARILVYGYDADTRSRECVSTQTIYQHADKFVKSLLRQRSDIPRRPIIFVAHSLGGIVLKQALVLCHNQSRGSTNPLRNILVSTHAVLFFGTPHSGVKGVELLRTINRLLSIYLRTTDSILQHLMEHSAALENIQNLYVSASEEIETVLFYEVYETPIIGGKRQMIVPRHSATAGGDRHATEEALDADHCEMVKFTSRKQTNYSTILSYIKMHVEGAMTAVTKKWATEDAHRAVDDQSSHEAVLLKPRLVVSRNYVDRPEIQSLITQNLLPDSHTRHQPRCILHGIGGAGKTQLAMNWIRDHESRFTRVIIIDASSQTQLEKDLETSIRVLGPAYSEMTWNDAVAYLDGKAKGWLLFFDNADSPDLDLRPYLPVSTHGAVLITTRNGECANYAPDGAVLVGDLEENEAIELLHRMANVTPQDDAQSLKIVRELGMLALAVTQAGAYIRKTRRLDAYLDTFRKHRDRLMRQKPDIGSEYTYSTYTAFDLSFNYLPEKTQEFLKLCAFLHPSLIPITLFEESTMNSFTTYTVLESCPPPESDKEFASKLEETLGSMWDEIEFQELIDSASRASFIEVSIDGLFYSIHSLFQVYIRDRMGEGNAQQHTNITAQLVLGSIRPHEGSNARLWHLLPHANAIPRSVQLGNAAHALAFHELYKALGDWESCRELLEFALGQLRQDKGEKHEDTIWIMSSLSIALDGCGEFDEMEKLELAVLKLRLETLGEAHPDTIMAMANLATTLRHRGRLKEAEDIERIVLARRLEIGGERHPETILARNNLATTLSELGQLDDAEEMYKDILTWQIETLGRQHADTIITMNNLAVTLQRLGQLEEAEAMQRQVLALQIDALGERHPETINAKSNLALTIWDRDRFDEAEEMQREILALQLELRGEEHPDTLVAESNLAITLYSSGQMAEAEKLQRKVLALRLELLGREHPDTLDASQNLSLTLCHSGQQEEGIKLLQETTELRIEVLGDDHPRTMEAKEVLQLMQPKRLGGSRRRLQSQSAISLPNTTRSVGANKRKHEDTETMPDVREPRTKRTSKRVANNRRKAK
ncbi:SubName: Full=Related to kinesin light chain {ECO:0000313/EMBL:CCA74840.1} [Serendipita indica DSM 11827]|nr:SubName: Full=Related to kinesin light chain {ECO:0000313/EMBL:CCA74840.1} [Serendipita indica DSM 11827]